MVKTKRLADYPPLEEGIIYHIPQAAFGIIKPVIRPADSDQPDTPVDAPTEKQHGGEKNHQEYKYLRCQSLSLSFSVIVYFAAEAPAFLACISLT